MHVYVLERRSILKSLMMECRCVEELVEDMAFLIIQDFQHF